MLTFKINDPFEILLNSKQKHFGVTGFKVELLDLSNGDVTKLDVDVEEIVVNIDDPATATVATAAVAGENKIAVKDSTLKDGMVFDDGNGNKYYIVDVDDTYIYIKGKLVADIDVNATLTQVGNTGIYKIPLTINQVGKYSVVVSNPSVNLRNLATFIRVVEYDNNDIIAQINTSKDTIMDKLNEIEQAVGTSEDDYEVVG